MSKGRGDDILSGLEEYRQILYDLAQERRREYSISKRQTMPIHERTVERKPSYSGMIHHKDREEDKTH